MSQAASSPAEIAARERLRHLTSRQGELPVAPEPRRLRAVLAYDGTAYSGWQRQREVLSVQLVLEAALAAVTGVPAVATASGRTDAGVHAEGQVVAIDTRTGLPPSAVEALANQVLPRDVALRRVEEAPPGFDPQRGVVGKLYRYTLRTGGPPLPSWTHRAWQLPGDLDCEAMCAASARLVGRHDFRAFRNDPGPERRGEDTVRTVTSIDVARAWELIRIEVRGPGFLYMMVRNITAALVEVGAGRRAADWISEVLERRERPLLPPPAPPAGLTLVEVSYGDGFPGSATRDKKRPPPPRR